jgi:predicted nucleic acid-binding protein
VIIADTSGLYAIFNRRQPEYQAARTAVERDGGPLVQAARHKTTRILSLDHKHFTAVRPLTGDDSFTLIPRDDQA